MPTSSVPQIQFTAAGLVIPAESDILNAVQADMNSAFGGGLNPALETPQGQLASSQTAIIADKNAEFALFVNQVDPTYADGRFQDAIGRIYFLTRKPATATAVACTLTGTPGAIVPAGALAQDTLGNTYALSGAVTIGLAGTVSGSFQNIVTGPIACAANTLTQVYQAITGWDAVNNPTSGTVGSDVESRADFEYRRRQSVALNALGTLNSIYANVFDVNNVLDVYAIDNPSGSTVNVGSTSYPVIAHSVYVAVVGGTDAEVAKAIWLHKDLGCDYNGNASVTVVDDSGYSYPQPSYVIKFQRPSALPIKFAVSIVNDPSLPSNIVSLIQADILARFYGTDGGTRERIGSNIYASRYYGAVAAASVNVAVISILIGTSTPTLSLITVGIDRSPSLSVSDITVTLV